MNEWVTPAVSCNSTTIHHSSMNIVIMCHAAQKLHVYNNINDINCVTSILWRFKNGEFSLTKPLAVFNMHSADSTAQRVIINFCGDSAHASTV